MKAASSIAIGQAGFVLNGTLTGYEDSIRIIFNKILGINPGEMEDDQTVYLVDGRFSFSDNIAGPTFYSIRIRPKDSKDIDLFSYENVSILADNKIMTFTAARGNVAFADVKGNEMQHAYAQFLSLEKQRKTRNKNISDSLITYASELPANKMNEMTAVYRENIAAITKTEIEHSLNNPQFYFSVKWIALQVKYYPESMEKHKVFRFYEQINPEYKDDVYGREIKKYIDNTKVFTPLAVRNKARQFILADSTGTRISLSSFKGRVVLVDFWFAGCSPCRAEHQNYLRLYKVYRQKGFEIVSINSDRKKEVWMAATQADSMIWKSVWDPQNKVTGDIYGVNSFPSNFLVDGKGKIIAQDLRGEALVTALADIFKE
jgi:thiol-disulfide isomerase/thioredoxin